MEDPFSSKKDFSTVSPSARWLILMKGYTDIPFARQAAEWIASPKVFQPDYSHKDFSFWARTLHFEQRYWSIDQLLEGLPAKQFLELSSGYSLRGLEMIRRSDVHYIDTDLPGVIDGKKALVANILNQISPLGHLELLPLNVLDRSQFDLVVNRFDKGELIIMNEGLLMYLNLEEKEQLCQTVYDVLKTRGGYWIVADIYLRYKLKKLRLNISPKMKSFFEQHQVEENKFESFAEAEQFFNRMGFRVDKAANIHPRNLTSWKYLWKKMTPGRLFRGMLTRRIQATWRLRIAPDN